MLFYDSKKGMTKCDFGWTFTMNRLPYEATVHCPHKGSHCLKVEHNDRMMTGKKMTEQQARSMSYGFNINGKIQT